jgi:hypothetical protein
VDWTITRWSHLQYSHALTATTPDVDPWGSLHIHQGSEEAARGL